MLVQLSLVFLMCGYFSSADTNNDKSTVLLYADQKNENDIRQVSFQPLTPNEANKKLLKNCKEGNVLNDGELIPTYSRRLIKPVSQSVSRGTYALNTDLTPQSLKDGDFNDELKSENDQVLQYAPNQLLNVYVDQNEENYDDDLVTKNKDKLQRRVYDEKNFPKQHYPGLNLNDEQNENYNLPKEVLSSTNLKYPVKSQNPTVKNVDSSLSSDEDTLSEKCLKIKSPESTRAVESRRSLSNNNEVLESALNDQDNLDRMIENADFQNNYDLLNTRHSYNQLNDDVLSDPTTGLGVSRLTDTKMMLMENSRVCYACSSAANPSCLNPDRRTTVKYCRKGHDSCVTKTFIADGDTVLIRDCAKSCDVTTGITPKYKSCSVCHSDLCNDSNGAYSVNGHNLTAGLMIIYLIKCAF